MTFPDKKYLSDLLDKDRERLENYDPESRLLAYSGAFLNSVADYLLDANIRWRKRIMNIDDLKLTGTNPRFNEVVLKLASGSPEKLREIIKEPATKRVFGKLVFSARPILVMNIDGQYRIFDGMHRTIAAILKGKNTITAYVGKYAGKPKPICEPHVIYDFIRSYKRGVNTDRRGLIAALRFLKKSYSNVGPLLKTRFDARHIKDPAIQKIIKQVLNGNK